MRGHSTKFTFAMVDIQIATLWKRATEPDAPPWLSELILEIKRLQARLEAREQKNATLVEQLAHCRRQIAA